MVGSMMGRLGVGVLALLLAVACAVIAGPATAQSLPPLDVQRDQLTRELPPLWHLETFSPGTPQPGEAAAKDAPDRPVVQAFTAVVSLSVSTFTIDSQRGPFTLLRAVAEQGTRKTLSGLIKSTRREGGGWTVRVGIQNIFVLDNIGQPADRFQGRTAIVGSPEAAKLLGDLEQTAKQQNEAEAQRQRRQQEQLDQQLSVVKAEAQRIAADHALVDQRAAALASVKRQLLEGERPARIAAYEAAMKSDDVSVRAMALSAALTGRDTLVANLALRHTLVGKKSLPVQLFATRENKDSETVLNNLGPLTLTIERFDGASGAIEGKMGAPGYSIALPGSATGYLAQTELTVNTYGCSLQLRLSEVETLDGVFRCQTLPALIARITLD
ncbi:MAG: hypothetical protein WCO00_10750 [Rhodospirillaceae bacterium]